MGKLTTLNHHQRGKRRGVKRSQFHEKGKLLRRWRREEIRWRREKKERPPKGPPRGGAAGGGSKPKAKGRSSPAVDEAFERFWAAYPKRDMANPRKPAAEKFAVAVKNGVDPEDIIAGAQAYARQLQAAGKIGTSYVAQAVTWLNQMRWADELGAASGSNGPRATYRGRKALAGTPRPRSPAQGVVDAGVGSMADRSELPRDLPNIPMEGNRKMGKKTGNPRGRPPGAKNKRTREREIALAQAADKLREVMGDTFDGDAHALMTMLYQNQSLPLELRLDAAKAAAPYERPKLSSVEHKKPPIDLSKLTDDELDSSTSL
jgi:hypothetical protein